MRLRRVLVGFVTAPSTLAAASQLQITHTSSTRRRASPDPIAIDRAEVVGARISPRRGDLSAKTIAN
jgi:hypothetical protein